jgi:hypothetical protein
LDIVVVIVYKGNITINHDMGLVSDYVFVGYTEELTVLIMTDQNEAIGQHLTHECLNIM